MQCSPLLSVTGQRILSRMKATLPGSYEKVQTIIFGLAVVKVSLRLVPYKDSTD